MQRKNILRKTFVTGDKWKGAAARVKLTSQVRKLTKTLQCAKLYFIGLSESETHTKNSLFGSIWTVSKNFRTLQQTTFAFCYVLMAWIFSSMFF
jgi:hypothetical protein